MHLLVYPFIGNDVSDHYSFLDILVLITYNNLYFTYFYLRDSKIDIEMGSNNTLMYKLELWIHIVRKMLKHTSTIKKLYAFAKGDEDKKEYDGFASSGCLFLTKLSCIF